MSNDILRGLKELKAQQARTSNMITALVRDWRKNAQDAASRAVEAQMLAELISSAKNTADALETIFGERDGQETKHNGNGAGNGHEGPAFIEL